MAGLGKLRSLLYRAARTAGDVQAIEKGHVGRRVERRVVGRLFARILGKLFR